jgi:hypothetical protein
VCQKGGTFSRHSALSNIIRQALTDSKVYVPTPTLLEPPGMFRTDGKRVDGVTLAPWSEGNCLVWYATCVDTVCNSYVSASSQTPGAAAVKAEKKKTRDSQLPQYLFCPFAAETLGTFGEGALQLVRELGGQIRAFIWGCPRNRLRLTDSTLQYRDPTRQCSEHPFPNMPKHQDGG